MEQMTARELDVLRILLAGATNKEIARRLQISEATVENHLHRMYGKLGVRNRTEAALKAMQSGVYRPDLLSGSEPAFDTTARAW
jgi:DNA-binding NarL/FixJ family response regulator